MDKQAKIALEVELLQVENSVKANNASLNALLFANAQARLSGKPEQHKPCLVEWYQARIMKDNGRIVEITLQLAQ